MADSHDSKRIQIHQYYTPKLPSNTGIPALTSNRIAGDYSIQTYAPAAASTSYPQVPDDIQAKLVHVGMKVRKHVAEGHRVEGSIPSYQANFSFNAGSPAMTTGPVLATRNKSAPAMFASESSLGMSQGSSVAALRQNLKRGRLDEEDEGDDDTDNDEADMEPASFQDSGVARRAESATAKVVHLPAPADDFEEAAFLASRESVL